MIGLKRGTVALCPHDLEWEAEAARTIRRLRAVLGDTAKDLQHVGSTSVPSICAKPIIDIALAVDDFSELLSREEELREAGFYFRPGTKIDHQLLFACGSWYEGSGDEQTHFIHAVLTGSREWTDYIDFRDYLIAHPDAARAYETLKLSLAEAAPVDAGREQYLRGKHDFIAETLEKARRFRGREL